MGIASSVAQKSKTGVIRLIKLYDPRNIWEKGIMWELGLLLATYAVIVLVLSFYWGSEPNTFDVRETALEMTGGDESRLVTGYVTAATTIRVAETLLDKPGGYLSNDMLPPGILMDNIPNWEFGVLVQLRDMARSLRSDFSRSRTQSIEDKDLIIADPQFHFNSESWILPSTEAEYRKGIAALERFLNRLNQGDAQFFNRGDNLRDYLGTVGSRLGSLSQRLGASVSEVHFDTYVAEADEEGVLQAIATPGEQADRTPWMEIDNVFYEARGTTWALLHFFRAIEHDFSQVLKARNAEAALRQVIRELEGAQSPMLSPIVLNGSVFGFMANHSLAMASYISRANGAIMELRQVLIQG